MTSKIAIVGAGAIGSSVAADLVEAGFDITIFDQWPEHVNAIREHGLTVTHPDRTVHANVDAHHLCDLATLRPSFDIALVCVKSYDTPWATQLIEPYLKNDGVLVGIQNSMTVDTHVEIVGRERVIGCVVELAAEHFEPGKIKRNTMRTGTWIGLGELDGTITPRLESLQAMLSNVAKCDLTQNIYGAKWTKLVTNTMSMGINALMGLPENDAANLPGMMEVSIDAGREAVAVGNALGYTLEPVFGLSAEEFASGTDDVLEKAVTTLLHHIGPATSTMVQDNMKGRRSEWNELNGLVAQAGAAHNIPTPKMDAVVELSGRLDRREIEMGVENYDRLKALFSED